MENAIFHGLQKRESGAGVQITIVLDPLYALAFLLRDENEKPKSTCENFVAAGATAYSKIGDDLGSTAKELSLLFAFGSGFGHDKKKLKANCLRRKITEEFVKFTASEFPLKLQIIEFFLSRSRRKAR